MSEQSARSRARWAIREGAIIGGILGFWLVALLALTLLLSVVANVALMLNLEPFYFFHSQSMQFVLPLVLQAATANVALYTLVRVGMLIIDHWRKTSPAVQGA
ncbi:hypothetical protein [Haladaptatus sp. ZSTT2]|uniref:hypothetical protein n=1 Tax=Haladaptatus sp. ZSTT2 TaxID=3120515 RepID=UPI00300F452D